ncbi:MAG TPA: DUF1656 domain-containing protein [Novimethylophilus sp.]|jgi:hypothetical protein|uniref:DUF1656 domain-containing protein n=1 Tax=Novimethylophilus sp. TaxID=2137426 RepID=UPI002F42AD92
MPREVALFDALVPALLFAFLAAACVWLALDWLFVRYGIYRHIWYPALFRLAVFASLFAACGLWIY